MSSEIIRANKHGNAYNISILVLTIISLLIMVVLLLPLDEATLGLLRFYDNLICIVFLADFFISLMSAPVKSDYLIKEHGWLDLLGSIPSFGGVFRFAGLLRLVRLSRLARTARLLSSKNKKALLEDVVTNRSQYVGNFTIMFTLNGLSTASVLELQFENQAADGNIHTGWDAFWFLAVTITTVGFYDRYPVTFAGRITAMFIMFMGVGIIGVLASILSSLWIGAPAQADEDEPVLSATPGPGIEQELESINIDLVKFGRCFRSRVSVY
jgi:voltage-gated potassium channel